MKALPCVFLLVALDGGFVENEFRLSADYASDTCPDCRLDIVLVRG